jgi:hypothetical protein
MGQTTGGSTGSGRVPEWMAAAGLKEGEWYIDSKLRARRAMTSKCFSPAARLHIWLGLATMGFQTELATKMEAGKRVPASPTDACAATRIRREHFRKHFQELAAMGLAECRGSTKGRVELYGWAVPRPVDVKKIVPETVTIFDGCPPDLAPLLKRYRINFPPGFVTDSATISELQHLAQVTFEAELSLRNYADCLRGRASLNKEESNGKEPMKVTGPPPPPNGSDTVGSRPAKADEEDPAVLVVESSQYATLKTLYPQQRFDEPTVKPLFESMGVAHQAHVNQRLKVYLNCERWQASLREDNGQYIPLASNWLPKCDAGPPPRLRKKTDVQQDDDAAKIQRQAEMLFGFRRGLP